MADNARKKEKQRLKRKQKQLAHRKAQSVSPLVKIGRTGGTLECWVNEGWENMGMADVLVLGHAGGGNYASGVFLIDTWCVGLKDAWGRVNVSRQDFEERMLGQARGTLNIVKLDVDVARRLLAGAIRFSRRNGFKLPPHYERWTAIFGNLGDIASADISNFGINGKLRYVGTMDFLRQRLISSSAEEFMGRKDVEIIMNAGGSQLGPGMGYELGDDDNDDDDYQESDETDLAAQMSALGPPPPEVQAEIEHLAAGIVQATEAWCKANGVTPHPFLGGAAKMIITATMAATAIPGSTPVFERVKEIIARLLMSQDEQTQRDLLGGFKQIKDSDEALKLGSSVEGSATGAEAPPG